MTTDVSVDRIILDLTPVFNELDKDNCKLRRETFELYDLVRLILEGFTVDFNDFFQVSSWKYVRIQVLAWRLTGDKPLLEHTIDDPIHRRIYPSPVLSELKV